MSDLVINGIFEKENRLDRFIASCNSLYRDARFLAGRMNGYLQSNDEDNRHMRVSHLQDDLLMEMQILKQACKHFVRKTYYSDEKRQFYYDMIDDKMSAPQGIIGYVILSYKEVMASFSVFLKRNIYTLRSMKHGNPEVIDYLDKIMNILNERSYDFQNFER